MASRTDMRTTSILLTGVTRKKQDFENGEPRKPQPKKRKIVLLLVHVPTDPSCDGFGEDIVIGYKHEPFGDGTRGRWERGLLYSELWRKVYLVCFIFKKY